MNSRKSGAQWEQIAESFLRRHGLRLLQRNFSSRFGEIDLIMEDEGTLVFVEVRYRKSNDHGSGAESVTYHKQGKISRTAAWYLAKNPLRAEQFCRFDVVSIAHEEMDSLNVIHEKKTHEIDWLKAAFYSTIG